MILPKCADCGKQLSKVSSKYCNEHKFNHIKTRRYDKGHTPWNKGIKTGVVPKTAFKKGDKKKENGYCFPAGKLNNNWKENPSYVAMHIWVKRWKGKISQCSICGTTTAKKFEWANIDHKYRRVLEDYIGVCTSCHRKYDIKLNNYKADDAFIGGML